jgi:N-acetylneuraminate synthase/N,N'-diacetyllegionaminate synthase
MRIGTHEIGPGHPPFIAAEIGLNHNGDVDLALCMVKAAHEAGVDAVKFQAFHASEFCSPGATYQGTPQAQLFGERELSDADFLRIKRGCDGIEMIFFATPTDRAAVDMLLRLDVPCFKVGSDDIVHVPLLRYIAETGRPIILSTGMATDDEIRRAIEEIRDSSPLADPDIALLHCVSLYPTPPHLANLRRIFALSKHGVPVGYSDHTDGIEAATIAMAMGACIIEKHFTLDKAMIGWDHKFSATPTEMLALRSERGRMQGFLGDGSDTLSCEERDMRVPARRSVRAAWNMEQGTVLGPAHLAYKRPGDGLPPSSAHYFLGKRLTRNLGEMECIRPEDVE